MAKRKLEIRTVTDVVFDANTVRGTAIVYDKPSVDLGGFVEVIKAGAVDTGKRDIAALYAHDSQQILGRTSSGTLKLTDTADGMAFELNMPDTTTGRDVKELIKRGDVKGASFGFKVPNGGETWTTQNGQRIRQINKLSLYEITITPFPAYQDTSLALRSLEGYETTQQGWKEQATELRAMIEAVQK